MGRGHLGRALCFPFWVLVSLFGVLGVCPSLGSSLVSRSAEQKQEVYYPRVSAEAEDVRYTIRGFGVLIKNDFEV